MDNGSELTGAGQVRVAFGGADEWSHKNELAATNQERQREFANLVSDDERKKLENLNFSLKTEEQKETGAATGEQIATGLTPETRIETQAEKGGETEIRAIEKAVAGSNSLTMNTEQKEMLESVLRTGLPVAKDRDGLEPEYIAEVERIGRDKSPRNKVKNASKLAARILKERYGRTVGDGNNS